MDVRKFLITAGGIALSAAAARAPAEWLNFSGVPPLLGHPVPSNLMLVMDSSSAMNAIATTRPYDPQAIQPVCPLESRLSNQRQVELYVEDLPTGAPRIALSVVLPPATSESPVAWVDEVLTFGFGPGQRCFEPGLRYTARLRVDREDGTDDGSRDVIAELGYRHPGNHRPALYDGHFLNWYFDAGNTAKSWSGGEPVKPLDATTRVSSRGEQARSAAKAWIGTLDEQLRVGLCAYDGGNGGALKQGVAPTGKAQRDVLIAAIEALKFSGPAPLAETLAGIGRYFTTGYPAAQPLTLHPGEARQSRHPGAELLPLLQGSERFTSPPINASCQQSSVILMIAGSPDQDRDISEPLRDYDGDCSGANAAGCVAEPRYDRKADRHYEAAGSDYLDDVAQALHEIDLRPDFPGESSRGTPFANTLTTHVIGLTDEVIGQALFTETAVQGGGRFIAAADDSELQTALASLGEDALARRGSYAAVALNTTLLTAATRVFQARFDSSDWSGDLSASPVATGSSSGHCAGIDSGRLCSVEWSAAQQLDAREPDSRVILSLAPATATGIPFRWAALEDGQKALLNLRFDTSTRSSTSDGRGAERLAYLRGDRGLEGPGKFRARGSRLGDIIDSEPIHVGPPARLYTFPGHAAYRAAQTGRMPVVYVGANDGMLHGFRASDGREVLAYVPNALFGRPEDPRLAQLTADPYAHVWAVDGALAAEDVQIGTAGSASDWRTYLVGALRYGGQALFALDVTRPETYSEDAAANIVKWEFTDANSGIEGRDLGRTFSQPFVVKMKNGKWAAVIGNGYNNSEADGHPSSSGRAALFIIFVDGPGADGFWQADSEYLRITVPGGSPEQPNGLSSAAPADIDADGLIDYIYAGDLLGNLWQFDVNSSDPQDWGIGYGSAGSPQPLFVATDSGGVRQAITAIPEVGLNLLTPTDPDDVIVYFGTGRFLVSADNSADGQRTQSFYGIFDNPIAATADTVRVSAPTQRSQLLRQTIERETAFSGNRVRLTSAAALDPAIHRGWYIDLLDPEGAAATVNRGERQVTRPLLRNGRIVFSTLIPAADSCDAGGGGGFLMELDAQTGARPAQPALDITNDLKVDSQDRIPSAVAGEPKAAAVSGIGLQSGIPSAPRVLALPPNRELKLVSGSSGGIEIRGEAGPSRSGRITWREINP